MEMQENTDLGTDACAAVGHVFDLTELDLEDDACLSKRGMTFTTKAWHVKDVGHLCVMRMRAFFGLMSMETVILAPTEVDMPLLNIDRVRAMGTQTQIVEMYDTQLEPWPDAWQAQIQELSNRDRDLPDAPATEAHWYDDVLYPCSMRKKGKGLDERLSATAHDCLAAYVAQLEASHPCDHAKKEEKVAAFARRLFAEGGPAVNTFTKLFGTETAERMVVQNMYGARLS
jgi:hypothetical protein